MGWWKRLVPAPWVRTSWTVQPGRVFDRTINLDDVPDGYRAMDDREALKILVKP